MATPGMSSLIALLILAAAVQAGAPVPRAPAEPLPEGAKLRLGSARYGPTGSCAMLPPTFEAFLVPRRNGFALHDAATGKVAEPADNGAKPIPDGIGGVCAVSADGTRAVANASGPEWAFRVIETATGKVLQLLASHRHNYTFTPQCFSADGKRVAHGFWPWLLVVGNEKKKLEAVVWDVDRGAEVVRVAVLQNDSVSAALSPDGKTLATFGRHSAPDPAPGADAANPGAVVQLWDVSTGKQLAALGDAREIWSIDNVAFAPDGKTLVTASGPGGMALWDVPTGTLKAALPCRTAQGVRLAFAPDGKTLAAVDPYGVIERWSLPAAKPLKATPFPGAGRLPPGSSVEAHGGLGFADNDRVVAWARVGNRMVAWDAPSGNLLTPFAEHPTGVQSVQFAANGREIVTAGAEGRVVRWDADTAKVAHVTAGVETDSYTPDAPIALAPGGRRGLRGGIVFDAETGREAFRLPGTHALPSADFTHAITFGQLRQLPANGTTPCGVWNLDTRERVSGIEIPGVVDANQWRQTGLAGAASAFSPDNSRLVTVVAGNGPGRAGPVWVVTGWEVKTGKKLGEYAEECKGPFWEVAAANTRAAVLSAPGGTMWVVDYEKGERVATIDDGKANHSAGRPTFGPDGKTFAVAAPTAKPDGFGVRVYSWPEAKLIHTFAGHTAPVTALAFAPDGKTLASGSFDGTVLVWDLSAVGKK